MNGNTSRMAVATGFLAAAFGCWLALLRYRETLFAADHVLWAFYLSLLALVFLCVGLRLRRPGPAIDVGQELRNVKAFALIAVAGLATAALGLAVLIGFARYDSAGNVPNRRAVAAIVRAVEVGDGAQRVREVIHDHRTPDLELWDDDAAEWSVTMPPELGATEWVLSIRFEGGRVEGMHVGTYDDYSRTPCGAPPDKGRWPARPFR